MVECTASEGTRPDVDWELFGPGIYMCKRSQGRKGVFLRGWTLELLVYISKGRMDVYRNGRPGQGETMNGKMQYGRKNNRDMYVYICRDGLPSQGAMM